MQDRYVGDIGDYAKYGLLRALSIGKQLGVAWYLYQGGDGRFIHYLDEPDVWKELSPNLFVGLKSIIDDWKNNPGPRSVRTIQQMELLPVGTKFTAKPLDTSLAPATDRENWRRQWFKRVKDDLKDCEIVFADPDKGLVNDNKFKWSGKNHGWQHMPLCEAIALSDSGRPTVIYHHNRREGNHKEEIQHWIKKFPKRTYAFRCRRGTSRTFFVTNSCDETAQVLKEFVRHWREVESKSGFKLHQLSQLFGPDGKLIKPEQ